MVARKSTRTNKVEEDTKKDETVESEVQSSTVTKQPEEDEKVTVDAGTPNEAVKASQGRLADGQKPGEAVNLTQYGDDDKTVGKDQDRDAYSADKVLVKDVEPNPSSSPDKFAKDVQSKAEASSGVRSVTIDVPVDKKIQEAADSVSARGTGGQTYRAYIQAMNGGLMTAQYDTTENAGPRGDLRNVVYSMQLEDLAKNVASGDASEKDVTKLVGDNPQAKAAFEESVKEAEDNS